MRLVGGDPARFPPKIETLSAPYQFVNLGSAIFRRSVFSKVGLFDESLTFNEDTDWFLRAWEHNVKKIVLDRISLFYCLHDSNIPGTRILFISVFRVSLKSTLSASGFRNRGPPEKGPGKVEKVEKGSETSSRVWLSILAVSRSV